jgi:hypothetical protein
MAIDLADFEAVQQTIEQLLLASEALVDRESFEKLTRKAKFTEIEYALLLQFRGQIASRQRKLERQAEPLTLENLVLQFAVPAEVIQAAMAGLYVKLTALLPKKK